KNKWQIAPVFRRQLQDRIQADLMFSKNSRQGGDNARAIFHAKAHVVGRLKFGNRPRPVFAQPLVGEGADASRAAEPDLARYLHQVADYGNTSRSRSRAAPIVKGIFAVEPFH